MSNTLRDHLKKQVLDLITAKESEMAQDTTPARTAAETFADLRTSMIEVLTYVESTRATKQPVAVQAQSFDIITTQQ